VDDGEIAASSSARSPPFPIPQHIPRGHADLQRATILKPSAQIACATLLGNRLGKPEVTGLAREGTERALRARAIGECLSSTCALARGCAWRGLVRCKNEAHSEIWSSKICIGRIKDRKVAFV
jgi:hypothetical protein